MPAIAFGQPTTFDAVLDAIEARITAVTGLPRERVFSYAGEPDGLLGMPPAEQFVAVWFNRLPPIPGLIAGGGAAHTAFDSSTRIDAFARLGTDREQTDVRLLRDASRGLGALAMKAVKALQVWTGSADGATSPFIEPPRLGPAGVVFNPRKPATGWGWARVELNAKFRTDFTV